MRRGDLVTVRQKGPHTSKPRPAVIVQASVTIAPDRPVVVCLLTSDLMDDPPFFRIDVGPTPENGLEKPSQIMADLPIPILWENVGDPIGTLDPIALVKVNTALALFLELA